MSEDRDQAQHAPTPSRLRTAQDQGNIAISRELSAAVTWLLALGVLAALGSGLWRGLQGMVVAAFEPPDLVAGSESALGSAVVQGGEVFWSGLVPLLAGLAVAGVISVGVQTRFALFPERPLLDIGRLNVTTNFQRLFSLPSWTAALLGLLKLAGLGLVAWWVVTGEVMGLLKLSAMPLRDGVTATAQWLVALMARLVVGGLMVGLADYGIRWWHTRRRLRMTDQELRDEQRAMESPAEVESRRRIHAQRQRDRDSAGR